MAASSSVIPFGRKHLSFVEGVLSYFSKKYRKTGHKWEFFWDEKKQKKVEIPFVYLWNPGFLGLLPGKWERDYCLNRPVMQLTVAISNAEKTLQQLRQRKKEAAEYENAQIESFAVCLNEIVMEYRDGKYVPAIAGAGYKSSDAPKAEDVKRIKCTASSDPRGGNNNRKGGNNS